MEVRVDKNDMSQGCHLPGFLGITILVAGSACQPWLTTPLGGERKKKHTHTQEVSPPAAVKRFERRTNFITALWKHPYL